MYLSYYGLKEKPFSISTDPKFLWLGEKHKEAFAVLKYGVLDNKGFLLLTGDVGAGKTTLIHALTLSLGDDVIGATVPDPGLGLIDFYKYIANEFKLERSFNSKTDFIIIFRAFLQEAHRNGKKVLLIIDEAQRLSNELLEEIRLLSNIELDDVKLLNIFFVGQIEFNSILIEGANRAVRQRITVSYHIKPLSEKETGVYIRHRLRVAGAKTNIFSFVAINQIYKYSKGCPRLINIVCDLAMLIGYSREIQRIGLDIIDESISSLEIEPNQAESDLSDAKEEYSPKKNNYLVVYACVLLLLIFGGVLFYISYDKQEKIKTVKANDVVDDLEKKVKITATPVKDKKKNHVKPGAETIVFETKKEKDALVSNNVKKSVDLAPPPNHQPLLADGSKLKNNHENINKNLNKRQNKFEKVIIGFNHNTNEFSDSAYKKLDSLSSLLIDNSDICVFITGYTDNLGTYTYNINLSTFRANIVKSYLIGKGVEKQRVKATGSGSENPIATNETAIGRQSNRRVEIEIFRYYK